MREGEEIKVTHRFFFNLGKCTNNDVINGVQKACWLKRGCTYRMVEIKSSVSATHITEHLSSWQCSGGISALWERTQPAVEIRVISVWLVFATAKMPEISSEVRLY